MNGYDQRRRNAFNPRSPAKRDFTAKRFHQPQADFTRPSGRISQNTPVKQNRSPAKRLRFWEEPQRNERTAAFHAKHKKPPQAIGSLRRRWSGRRDSNSLPPPWQGGALPNELRPQILPIFGRWCLRPESNWRHADFQSAALPTELPRRMATRNGLEPSTSSVTGWRSKPTELPGRMVGTTGLEPVTPCL